MRHPCERTRVGPMRREKGRRYCDAHNWPFRIPAQGTRKYKEWCLNQTVRNLCRSIYMKALRNKRLEHWRGKTCIDCGKPAQCYDHRNYYYPMRVDPVCQSCNAKRGEGFPYLGTQTEKDYRSRRAPRVGYLFSPPGGWLP